MLHYAFRLFILITVLIGSIGFGLAQNFATISTDTGILIDYPENWDVQNTEDFPDIVAFTNGSMNVGISIVPVNNFNEDPSEVLRFYTREIENEDDEIGDFGDIEEYLIDEQWDAVRAQRVRSDNRLIEILVATNVNDFSILLRGTLRIGAQDLFLPIFDQMMASVRDAEDAIIITHGSTAQRPLTEGMIGSVLAPLNIGALNTNFITNDERYQFEYPDTWDIHTETDGSITLIQRTTNTATLFARLIISAAEPTSNRAALIQARFDENVEVSEFMLNDLPASQLIIVDEPNNIRRLVMATVHGDVQAVLDATLRFDASTEIDAILRAILYSVRHNGEPFNLSISGNAIRTGLLSAEIYGSASAINNEIVVGGTILGETYVTLNGRFTFNYPSEWSESFINGYIVISNDHEIELFIPARGDVQLIFDFIEDASYLEDDFSAYGILNDLITNDDFRDEWSEITEFESVGRSAAYADFDIFGSDLIARLYFVKLDTIDNVFARVDMVIDEDDLDAYELITRAILDTIRFQD